MNFNDENVSAKRQKATKVRNKTPAPVQITAEQLLREAKERELEATPKPPQQKITTNAEKKEYQLQKRQDYENNIRKDKRRIINWMKYAGFEVSQGEIKRARNVFERALNDHHREVSVWLKYAEMEIEHGQINMARNLFERSLSILPRANQLWYKYVYMEEKLKNITKSRMVFKRWMHWKPEEQAWHSFINMEIRYSEFSNAREIYKSFVQVHPDEKNWIKWAKFEERVYRDINMVRNVFEAAVNFYGKENPPPYILLEFAKFEERQHEHKRVKEIFNYAMDNLPESMSEEVYKAYHEYEKKFGDKVSIQESIVLKRKHEYEKILKENPLNYDEWFNYVGVMQEENQKPDSIREIYERAISNMPPMMKKFHWRRYIYLWIYYAIYEERYCANRERAKEVYLKCLEIIPHRKFTFAKIWIKLAECYLRDGEFTQARKLLGNAIGKCPKNKLFRYYIDIETTMLEVVRVRKLYEKFILFCPSYEKAWLEFANFEARLKEDLRAREIFEAALKTELERPLYLWKEYIEFELQLENYEVCWSLYRRLLDLDGINKETYRIWVSFAMAQLRAYDEESQDISVLQNAREIFAEGNIKLRQNGATDQVRDLFLKEWYNFEMEYGLEDTIDLVKKKMPIRKTVSKRVMVDGSNLEGATSWVEEEVLEFPPDEDDENEMGGMDDILKRSNIWFNDDD